MNGSEKAGHIKFQVPDFEVNLIRKIWNLNRRWNVPLILAGLAAIWLSGCSTVKPWQRETLAMPGMQIDTDPLISGADDHIYFSREASKGGRSYGGGGCGCN